MCDILLACPQLLAVHGANLLKSLVETVEGNRVAYVAMQIDRIIAANLARVYCRLANYLPDVAKHYLLENEKMTRFVFGSLRTGEKQLATEESFRYHMVDVGDY